MVYGKKKQKKTSDILWLYSLQRCSSSSSTFYSHV